MGAERDLCLTRIPNCFTLASMASVIKGVIASFTGQAVITCPVKETNGSAGLLQ